MTNYILGVFEITIGMSLFIALLLLGIKLFGGKFTARCRYILWALVMLRLAFPVSLGFLPSVIEIPIDREIVEIGYTPSTPTPSTNPLPPSPPADSGSIAVSPSVPGTPSIPGTPSVWPSVNPEVIPPQTADTEMTPPPVEPLPETPIEEPVSLKEILDAVAVVYFVGAAGFLVWNLVSYGIYTGKILRSAQAADPRAQQIFRALCSKYGLKHPPTLLVATGIHSPAAFGIFRRKILLPAIEFNDNGLVGTLAHEVTHVRRGDLYVKLVELVARSLNWFNPLVHIAAFRCEMEMELSCDEFVLNGSSEATRTAYGQVMLDIIRRCRRNGGALTTHFNPKKSAVTARFKNILYGSGKRRGWLLIAVCLVLCALAGTFVACQMDGDKTEYTQLEGVYLKGNSDSHFIIDGDGNPTKIIPHDNSISFDILTDGDRIKVELDRLKAEIHSLKKLADGQRGDIDPAVLDKLTSLGWIDRYTVNEYTKLLSLTAAEIRAQYGNLSLTYLEHGGTPVVSVDGFDGVYLVYHSLRLTDFHYLAIPDDLVADEVIFIGEYGSHPAFTGEVYGLTLGKDIATLSNYIAWESADFHLINGTMYLYSTIDNYTLTAVVGAAVDPRMPDEVTATEKDWQKWEDAFVIYPVGNLSQIRITYDPKSLPAYQTVDECYRGVYSGAITHQQLIDHYSDIIAPNIASQVSMVLDAYRRGEDPNPLLPASKTVFSPYPVENILDNPTNAKIVEALKSASIITNNYGNYGPRKLILMRIDIGDRYYMELPIGIGGFGESVNAYIDGIYFGKRDVGQGPFVGYVADRETPWIELFTEKDGEFIARIPYEIFNNWPATQRTGEGSEYWQAGYLGDYIHFYYAEFGNFCWAGVHLTSTNMGSGRKNIATSSDGGKTWNCGNYLDDYGGNHVLGMRFVSEKVGYISYDYMYEHDLYAAGYYGPVIGRTTDGGKTWERWEIEIPESLIGRRMNAQTPHIDGLKGVYPIVVYPSEDPYYSFDDIVYLVTNDGGLTWEWDPEAVNGGTEYISIMKDHSGKIALYADADGETPNSAKDFRINFGMRNTYFSTTVPAHIGITYAPKLFCMDIAVPGLQKDGLDDAIVILTTGTGTGAHTEETYVISGADGTLYSVTEPYNVIKKAVQNGTNGEKMIMNSSGEMVVLRKDAYFDTWYDYFIEDGCLYAKVWIGYGVLQYLNEYFIIEYDAESATWEYVSEQNANNTPQLESFFTSLFSMTADAITAKYGKMSLVGLRYGGTPAYKAETLYGVELLYSHLNAEETLPADMRVDALLLPGFGSAGKAIPSVCGISIDSRIEDARVIFDSASYDMVKGYVYLYLAFEEYRVSVQISLDADTPVPSTEKETTAWAAAYAKAPRGKVIGFEVRKNGGEAEQALRAFNAVLSGTRLIIDKDNGLGIYLPSYLQKNGLHANRHALVDLDGDGVQEMVLKLGIGENEDYGFLLLHHYNNDTHAYLLNYREFTNLKTDGTFQVSAGIYNHGIAIVSFNGDTCTKKKVTYCEGNSDSNVRYYVNNTPTTKAAFDSAMAEQNKKTDVSWKEIPQQTLSAYKMYVPSIVLDPEKLEYVRPMAMYGESRPQAMFDRTANIYPGLRNDAYADGVGYITFGICNDRKSPDYVSRYYTYRVTTSGGLITDVEEAETITRDIVLKRGKPYTGSLDGVHVCVTNQMYYSITISDNTISTSIGLYQTDAGSSASGTYTYDPKTGKLTVTTVTRNHDGNGNILVGSPQTVTGKVYEYGDLVHFLYDDEKATPLPLSFPKINEFPPDREDFIVDFLSGEWYHSFRDEAGDQFYCLALDPDTKQISFSHGFYDGRYAARYAGSYRVDYNRIIHATLQDNTNPGKEMEFVFSLGYSTGWDETGERRTTISIIPKVCDMENYRTLLGRNFGFTRQKATVAELDERAKQYAFVMNAYKSASEAAGWFRRASLAGGDGQLSAKDSVVLDGTTYFRVDKFDTYNDLRKYLEGLFSAYIVDQLLWDQSVATYISHEDKVYATPGMIPQNIRLGKQYYSVSKARDDCYFLKVTVEVLDTMDLGTPLSYQEFQFTYQYQNGKWVFTQFPHIR